MIKLQYEQADLVSNSSLRDAVQMLFMLGADIQYKKLVYSNWYVPDIAIYPYITEYSCFIKMSLSDRQWEVYEWLTWRQTTLEDETTKTLTRSEWKLENFTDPYELDWFVYIPSDIKWKDFSGEKLQIFIDNWCTILTTQEYIDLLPKSDPLWI